MIGVRGLPPGIRIPPIEPLSRAQEACPEKPAARPGMFGGGRVPGVTFLIRGASTVVVGSSIG